MTKAKIGKPKENKRSFTKMDVDEDHNDENQSKKSNNVKAQVPVVNTLKSIKNPKLKHELYEKYKGEKKAAKTVLKAIKRKQKKEKKTNKFISKKADFETLPPVPKSRIQTRPDSKSKYSETLINSDEEKDIEDEEGGDKFSSYFKKEYEPKPLISVTSHIHSRTLRLLHDLKKTIPDAHVTSRKPLDLKKSIERAIDHKYTDLIIVNEDGRKPNGLLFVHLPHGPTAYFRLTNVKTSKDLTTKKKKIVFTAHRPEILLSNFKTPLGRLVSRFFATIFHFEPEYRGRTVCTFHNERDFIFFRHHRYAFPHGDRTVIDELGPQFTMRLEWVQEGAASGDFEFNQKSRDGQKRRDRYL